jgi:hypothetical protein
MTATINNEPSLLRRSPRSVNKLKLCSLSARSPPSSVMKRRLSRLPVTYQVSRMILVFTILLILFEGVLLSRNEFLSEHTRRELRVSKQLPLATTGQVSTNTSFSASSLLSLPYGSDVVQVIQTRFVR